MGRWICGCGWRSARIDSRKPRRNRRRLNDGDTPLSERQRLYHDFIRENQGLEGSTPAAMAGLYQASGQNRWTESLKKAVEADRHTR
jgi:hypothetical protein